MGSSGSVCVVLLTGATDVVCTVTHRAVTLHVLSTACGHLSLRRVMRTLHCFMTAPSGGDSCHQFTVGHASCSLLYGSHHLEGRVGSVDWGWG